MCVKNLPMTRYDCFLGFLVVHGRVFISDSRIRLFGTAHFKNPPHIALLTLEIVPNIYLDSEVTYL